MTNIIQQSAAEIEAEDSMAFAARFKGRSLVEPAPQTETVGSSWAHNSPGAETKIVNGEATTTIRKHGGWDVAVDPRGPVTIGGVQIAYEQIPSMIAMGVFTQAQVDAARSEALKGNRVPFDEAPAEGAEADQQEGDKSGTEAEEQQAIDAHNAMVEEVYQANTPEVMSELIETFVADGSLTESVVMPAETVDKLYSSFGAVYERTVVSDFGVDAKLTEKLASPEEQATLRHAILYGNEGQMKRVASGIRDRLYQPETQAKLTQWVHAGGLKTKAGPGGEAFVLLEKQGGWVPLVDAITSRLIVIA